MRNIYLLILLCIAANISAQAVPQKEIIKDSAYIAMYTKMKELRTDQLESPEYKQYLKLSREYFSKIIREYNEPEHDVDTKAWLVDNWKHKTKFLSYESALRACEALETARHAAFEFSADYNELMIKTLRLYGPELIIELEKDFIKLRYPELKW